MRLGKREGRKRGLRMASQGTAEESKLHSEECEAGRVTRLSFFSNFYGITDITSLFFKVFKLCIYCGNNFFLHLLPILNASKFVFAYGYIHLAITFYSTTVFLSALSVGVLFLRNSFMVIKALTVTEADAALLTFPRSNRSVGHLKPAPSRPKASNFSLPELFARPGSVAHSQKRLEVPERGCPWRASLWMSGKSWWRKPLAASLTQGVILRGVPQSLSL